MKIIYLEWNDAVSRDNWEDIHQELPPQPILSVGFLVKKTKTHITIALSHDYGNEAVSNTLTVPRGMVVKETTLLLKRKK